MQVVVIKSSKFMSKILKKIFKIKPEHNCSGEGLCGGLPPFAAPGRGDKPGPAAALGADEKDL